jgi:hypothetical protein
MATFPTLTPSSRTYTPGEYPHTVYTGLSGDESRVRHSSAMAGSAVRLAFYGLTESDMLSILSHYQGQYGSFRSFDVPSALWSGMTDATAFTLTGYSWRYESSPAVADLPCGTHNVEVSLVSVPPEAVTVPGLTRSIVLSIATVPPATANGLDKTITASIEYGAVEVSGLAITVTITLTAGTASFTAEASGAGLVVTVGLDPGIAFVASGASLTVTVSLAAGSGSGNFINYANFASTSGLELISTSSVTNNHIYLTGTTIQDVGNVWTSASRSYNSNFSVEWVFECSGGTGADGYCLQWHTANNVNGDTGGSVGKVNSSNVAHAILFTTAFGSKNIKWWKNNAEQSSTASSLTAGWRQLVYYWADYNHSASEMKVYYSTTSTKPGSANHTFTSFSFGSTAYYMGFGAATGGLTDNHILKSWKAYS